MKEPVILSELSDYRPRGVQAPIDGIYIYDWIFRVVR